MHKNGPMKQRRRAVLMGLAGWLAGTAAFAMPVTQAVNQGSELVQVSPLPNLALKPDAGLAAIGGTAGVTGMAGVAGNAPVLMDLSKHVGAEFEAVMVKGAVHPGMAARPGKSAEQDLFGGAAKEELISTELKSVLRDLRGDLHELTGDHFRNAQTADEAERKELARRLDAAQAGRARHADMPDRPMTEDERRANALMLEQLIDELKPWAISVAVLFVLFHAARALLRKQTESRQLRGKLRRELSGRIGRPSSPEPPLKAQRVRIRQRVRLSAPSPSRSRRP